MSNMYPARVNWSAPSGFRRVVRPSPGRVVPFPPSKFVRNPSPGILLPKRAPAPFGKLVPPRIGFIAPVLPRAVRYLRPLTRFLPYVGLAFAAYDLWRLWRWYNPAFQILPNAAATVTCHADNAGRPNKFDWLGSTGVCTGERLPATPWMPASGYPVYLWECDYRNTGFPGFQDRHDPIRGWRYDAKPAYPPYILPPVDMPQIWPQIDQPPLPEIDPMFRPPLSPEPNPYKPLNRPRWRFDWPEGSQYGEPKSPPTINIRNLPRRPGPGERERKVRGNRGQADFWRRVLGKITSNASEAGDFLDAIHDALPDEFKTPDATMKEKFMDVYNHLDSVDMAKATENLWKNEVEDRYLGKFFGERQEELDAWGVDLGGLKI